MRQYSRNAWRISLVNDVVFSCRERPRHRIIRRHCSSVVGDDQGTQTGDFEGVGDGLAFELGVVWEDCDNNVGDFS